MLSFLLDTFFPKRCVNCQREGLSWICHECAWHGEGWPQEAYTDVFALAPFREPVIREAIHSLKYHGTHEVAEELVNMLWNSGVHIPEAASLIPVPTIFSRKRSRGYNQAELIARALAQRTGAPVHTALLCKTSKGSQVGKTKAERGKTGYALRKRAVVPECPLVLIDDLCTTGSTIEACRRALGRHAHAIVLARD